VRTNPGSAGVNRAARRWSARTRRNLTAGVLFVAPWIIGFFVFTLYPMLASLYYSFSEYHVKSAPVWIGLNNYGALAQDKLFWTALYNTGYMVVVAVPLGLLRCAAQSEDPRPIGLPGHLLPALYRPGCREHPALAVDSEPI
jgi:ABC-type polysaccharide transport system permease subunit